MGGFIRRFGRWLISGPLAAYGVFAFVRDEFLSANMRERLRIGGLIGDLIDRFEWYYWIIAGLGLLLVLTYLPKIRISAATRPKHGPLPTARAFRPDGLKLARGLVMRPTDHAQEYRFTVVNESGVDIPQCYVTLDKTELRMREQDEWKPQQEKLIDAPFAWNSQAISRDGRLFIGDGDRASFALGRSLSFSAMNAQTHEQVPMFEFTLALHGSDEASSGYELYIGYFYRLTITIRAKDSSGIRLGEVGYELCLRPTPSAGPAGGLDIQHVRRL